MPKTPRNKVGSSVDIGNVIGEGSTKVKKKIRDIERLLKRENLPADVRIENERALKALNVDLQNAQLNLRAKKIAKKYHMVRFFEKKKAIRKYKQAKKALDEVSKTEVRKDIKKARKVVKHSETDIAYVILFPKTEKYISLYPNPKEEDEETKKNPNAKKGMQLTEQRKREFRKEVEKLIDDDKLPFSIEDVVKGKNVNEFNNKQNATMREEIDAPAAQQGNEEEDEFFE